MHAVTNHIIIKKVSVVISVVKPENTYFVLCYQS
jgi:hypothetical protein